jgi:hypothetical protein
MYVCRSKVVVAANPQHALRDLQEALGPDMVPAEYGGPCTLKYTEYPADKAFVKFNEELVKRAAGLSSGAEGAPEPVKAGMRVSESS